MYVKRGEYNNRPVNAASPAQDEKIVKALCWLSLAVALIDDLLILKYLPAHPIVYAANGSGAYHVRDKYALISLSFFVLVPILVVMFFVPRFPMRQNFYLFEKNAQFAEAQHKFQLLISSCFFTSLGWWVTIVQLVTFIIWRSGRENDAFLDNAMLGMLAFPVLILIYYAIATALRRWRQQIVR